MEIYLYFYLNKSNQYEDMWKLIDTPFKTEFCEKRREQTHTNTKKEMSQ